MRMIRRVVFACAAAIALVGLAGCGTTPNGVGGRITVVAGENFWGDLVSQIGGEHVAVTSVLNDPSDDPHEYESSSGNAIAVAVAKLVVSNGLGYDEFMSELVDASGAHPASIDVADVLGVHGQDANPHLWYDTAGLPKVAQAIATELSTLDPAHRADFAANVKTFDASLRPVQDVIAQIRTTYAGTPIAYTEPVPGYLVEAAGLTLGIPASFSRAVEEGSDPSPRDLVAFDDAITSRTVKALMYNAQVTDAQTTQIKELATSSGVPVVGVTETMPPSFQHLQDWQLAQAQDLLAALQESAR